MAQKPSLLGGEVALAGVAHVGGDVGERLATVQLRDDSLTVVANVQCGDATLAQPRDGDPACGGVNRVLYQLGERLARIGLRACQPTDQLERIGGAQPTDDRILGAARFLCDTRHRVRK